MIDDSVFETISNALPAESPLSGPLRTATSSATPARNVASPAQTAPSNPPTKAFEKLDIKSPSPAPPSYEQTPPPGVPPPTSRPAIAQARALYRYQGADARDLYFEKDDRIAVHEYMNPDWWMGQNQRTGQEGIFPRSYVFVEHENKGPMPPQQQYGYPGASYGPPQQQNPYNSHVPPMAIAEGGDQQGQGGDGGKVGEYGKKFGKKLGNAAIFGAGATIGGNIVNSIF